MVTLDELDEVEPNLAIRHVGKVTTNHGLVQGKGPG
jgi:hypothetical protein